MFDEVQPVAMTQIEAARARLEGLSIISPLGPIGIDWAYGFDRTDALGRPAPA